MCCPIGNPRLCFGLSSSKRNSLTGHTPCVNSSFLTSFGKMTFSSFPTNTVGDSFVEDSSFGSGLEGL